LGLSLGRNAVAVWQDLVDGYGFADSHQSMQRFVRKLRGAQTSTMMLTPCLTFVHC
jgi:hypothetical protein